MKKTSLLITISNADEKEILSFATSIKNMLQAEVTISFELNHAHIYVSYEISQNTRICISESQDKTIERYIKKDPQARVIKL